MNAPCQGAALRRSSSCPRSRARAASSEDGDPTAHAGREAVERLHDLAQVQDHLGGLRRKRAAVGNCALGEVLELPELGEQARASGRGVRRLVARGVGPGLLVHRVVHGHRAVRV